MQFLFRVFDKAARLFYKALHRFLWHKEIEINGIPVIRGSKCISFGKCVSLNSKVFIQGSGGVSIGDYVTLSRGVTILTVGLDTKDYSINCMKPQRPHVLSSVTICDGVWIGANAMILPGVKISPRIIVAAGSIVTHNLDKEDWLYAGVPAKPIKSLK